MREKEKPMAVWRCGAHEFELGRRALVMGVLNVTPDSFSDGGRFAARERAVEHGLRMADEGADIVDVGGESSRPGAESVAAEEEIRRVCPVVGELAGRRPGLCLSVDTTKVAVARAALREGAAVVNDITGLEGDPEMVGVVAEFGAGCVAMHMRGTPRTMQDNPRYEDVVGEIGAYLAGRVEAAAAAGVARECVAIDPGIGFGKTVAHNLELLRRLEELTRLGAPVLVGPSRKSFIGKTLDLEVDQRLEGTLAACAIAVLKGAAAVRVHDVRAARRAVDLAAAIRDA